VIYFKEFNMLIYDPGKNISPHFKMYEIGNSETAARNGIDNTPTPAVLAAAQLTAIHVLEPVRQHFGIPFSPNSWYRSEALERHINEIPYRKWCARQGKRVTASSWKQYFALKSHPKGESVDFEIPGIRNDAIVEWIYANVPVYDQLIREFPRRQDPFSGWVHVSYSAVTNRKQRLVIE
jgi:hypothetical protein